MNKINSYGESDFKKEFRAWLENKLEKVNQIPSTLLSPSLSAITKYNGFTLLIEGLFGSLILGSASNILRFI